MQPERVLFLESASWQFSTRSPMKERRPTTVMNKRILPDSLFKTRIVRPFQNRWAVTPGFPRDRRRRYKVLMFLKELRKQISQLLQTPDLISRRPLLRLRLARLNQVHCRPAQILRRACIESRIIYPTSQHARVSQLSHLSLTHKETLLRPLNTRLLLRFYVHLPVRLTHQPLRPIIAIRDPLEQIPNP